MIKEAYCSDDICKLLKEKGFKEPCTALNKLVIKDGEKPFIRITHQKAMAWLREIHNIFIVIEPHLYDYINEKNKSYVCSLWVGDNYYEYIESRDYPSYEEATEAALKYCLKNLI